MKKESLKIALVQFNPVVGNPAYNAERIVGWLDKAKDKGGDFVLFGELVLAGYCSQDLFFNKDIIKKTQEAWVYIKEVASKKSIGVGLGMPRWNRYSRSGAKHLFNSFAMFVPDEIEFIQDKVCIPSYGEFDETRWFQSASIRNVKPRAIGNKTWGFLICEDGWNNKHGVPDPLYRLYSQDPIERLSKLSKKSNRPLDFFVNISASPDYIGKQELRLEMNKKIAIHYKTPIIFLNNVGAQDELIFSGRSFMLDNKGQVVFEMKAFEEDMKVISLDNIEKTKAYKPMHKMQELDGLMGTYLKDYFNKSKMKSNSGNAKSAQVKTVLGLSGGKDSTAVACILKRHLGQENVLGIMLPYKMGEYTQPASKKLAEAVANQLGIEVREIAITQAVDDLKKELKVITNSLAHQNLQARIRATILWTIANQENRVVINTTNFSEAAMGYGTIGGDLLGLPLIASLPATTVIDYLKWLKDQGETAITEEMINRPPSAELVPGQLDADELGAYSYIDPLIESLRMNYGDINEVIKHFSKTKSKQNNQYTNTTANKEIFLERLSFLAKKLLKDSEFKRWYYNKTPQFTPYSWLRWKWPVANGYFDILNP